MQGVTRQAIPRGEAATAAAANPVRCSFLPYPSMQVCNEAATTGLSAGCTVPANIFRK